MCSTDFLSPFVEVCRALCDGADDSCVMNLIASRIVKSLGLKGCFIKMKSIDGEHIDVVASSGLSEDFLFSKPGASQDCVCSILPEKMICVSKVQDHEIGWDQEAMLLEGVKSFAVLPVEVEQTILAMVGLFSDTQREFDKQELNFAQTLVGCGILSSVWKRREEKNIERESEYLRSFQEISSTINATLDIHKVLELVVTKVTTILGGKGCVVRLLDPKTQNLYIAQSHGLSQKYLSKGPVDAHKSLAENMAGEAIVVNDVLTDPRLQYPAELAEEGIRKLLSIPLAVRGKVIGVLRLYSEERPPFNKREINFATAIAQQCAFAIENARMYQRVQHEYQRLLVDFGYEGSSS